MKSYTRRAYQDGKAHLSTLDWPLTLISAVLFSLYIIFFSLYMHWFQIFIQDLAWFAYNGVDSKTWSFGQIVAISVWAEPLCEYFHLELRKLPCVSEPLPHINFYMLDERFEDECETFG